MVTIDLTDSERAILRDVLESTVSDLGMEIAGTDAQDFREHLKERREVINKAIEAIASNQMSAKEAMAQAQAGLVNDLQRAGVKL